MMSLEVVVISVVVILGYLFLYLALSSKLSSPKKDDTLTHWLQSVQNSLNQNNQNLTNTLHSSYQDLHRRLEQATMVMADLKREAGTFSQIGKSMRDLEDYLKSPKIRGGLGEQILKDLLSQVFPKGSFFIQLPLSSGVIVDAAIKTDAGLIPIDSKFPLENYQKLLKATNEDDQSYFRRDFVKDVRRHLKTIADKYISPDDGTVDFALIYLPSESVYYEVVNLPEILEYAKNLRVYPVSPTTLYAHLQTILLSFEGKKFETKSKEVLRLLRSFKGDFGHLEENLNTLNRHLTNAYGQMNQAMINTKGLSQKLDNLDRLELPESGVKE